MSAFARLEDAHRVPRPVEPAQTTPGLRDLLEEQDLAGPVVNGRGHRVCIHGAAYSSPKHMTAQSLGPCTENFFFGAAPRFARRNRHGLLWERCACSGRSTLFRMANSGARIRRRSRTVGCAFFDTLASAMSGGGRDDRCESVSRANPSRVEAETSTDGS